MKTYSFTDAGYLLYRRRLLQRFGIMVLALAAGVIMALSFQGPINWLFAFPPILLMLAVMGFSVNRTMKQQLEVWQSVRIVLGEDYVARQQINIPEIRIARNEITKLQEIERGICVHTASKFRSLVIPSELDSSDYAEIRSVLAAWMPVQPKAAGTQAKGAALVIVLMAGFGIIFFSSSLWLVLVAGVSVLGYYIYIFMLLQRDKGVDPKMRRNYAIAIGFLLFIFAMKLCILFDLIQRLGD